MEETRNSGEFFGFGSSGEPNRVNPETEYYELIGLIPSFRDERNRMMIDEYDRVLDRFDPSSVDGKFFAQLGLAGKHLWNGITDSALLSEAAMEMIVDSSLSIFSRGTSALQEHGINDLVRIFGVDSNRVRDAIYRVEDPELRTSMDRALDKNRWGNIKYLVSEYGVNSIEVAEALHKINNLAVKRAMSIALDKERWDKIRSLVVLHGVNSAFVIQALSKIDGKDSRLVMNYALDIERLKALGDIAKVRGVDSDSVKLSIETIEHPKLRAIAGFYVLGLGKEAGSSNQKNSSTGNTHQDPREHHKQAKPDETRVAPDRRIDILRGKDTSLDTRLIKIVLANLDHHRRKGKTDEEIYKLLARHFHPDSETGNEEVMKVLTKAYDKINKIFTVNS